MLSRRLLATSPRLPVTRKASFGLWPHVPAPPGLSEQPIHRRVLTRKRSDGHEYQPVGALPICRNGSDDMHGPYSQPDCIDQPSPVPTARNKVDERSQDELKYELRDNHELRRPQRRRSSNDDDCVNKRQRVSHPECGQSPSDYARLDSPNRSDVRHRRLWRGVGVMIGFQERLACKRPYVGRLR